MIYVILWMLIGLSTGAYLVYIDVTQEDTVYTLGEVLGMTCVCALLGPSLIGFFIHDKYSDRIKKFFSKPVLGRKE